MCRIPERFSLAAAVAAGLVLLLISSRPSFADEPPAPASPDKARSAQSDKDAPETPSLNLLEAMRTGEVAVAAEGTGDGRMTLSVTNRTRRRLNVVLPPGLIASSTTGQFGGMGGMGMGGMGGGMGGMGGGIGMGGGMGGMGGGMGGMGGGMGGMGGGMGGMGGGGTMPAMMGMMMLSRLIMTLVGDQDSWNMSSMMGGMGGGMGGMGMGGMGMGMRSVPPTGLPFATLDPNQSRKLPTRLVSLGEGPLAMPEKGEKLQVGDISDVNRDPRVQKALRRLAEDKAPERVAQLVMWNVSGELDWLQIAELSQGWANAHERALARRFVEQLDELPAGDSGRLHLEFIPAGSEQKELADALTKLFRDVTVLGLRTESGVAARPSSPGVACRVRLSGTHATPEALVQVAASDAAGRWVPAGKFSLKCERQAGKLDESKFADALAEGILGRLVRAQLSKGPRVKGKETYKVRIDNASPLILNGLDVLGQDSKSGEEPKRLNAISVPPHRSFTVPATGEVVEKLGLKRGVRVVAADLSGL